MRKKSNVENWQRGEKTNQIPSAESNWGSVQKNGRHGNEEGRIARSKPHGS